MTTAKAKAMGLPVARAVHFAKRLKNEDDLPGLILSSSCGLKHNVNSCYFDRWNFRKHFMSDL
jgi:hypothetical protein